MFRNQIRIGDTDYDFKEIFMDFFASQVFFAQKILHSEDNAKDVVQDVFLKLWEGGTVFRNQIAFRSFLYISTRNACIDHLRKTRRLSRGMELAADIEAEIDEAVKEEAFRILDAAILSLPAQSRRIMEMTIQGLSIQEIAETLAVSPNTVKTLKQRIYKNLRRDFGDMFMILLMIAASESF